ncbi:DUF2459 domain-containing protein [Methylovirgula sp. 4M-Z18]|uniref:DUF2459 domain-containing protein n=1 Tax=Methylovirgula sp. 4M-Z18 TaxID=2293567 RepID=UPI000E2E78C6|nr:DUF2459 domain-containing protein [Methylovirgula sp. 4M-Z18]RFB79999.1 DUF2459 domain-containing protein [Methylovirgula sp. 4M-Z18]
MVRFFSFLLRTILRLVVLVVALLAIYAGFALGCALMPQPGRAQYPIEGDAPAFVCATPVHADLVLPVKTEARDWRVLLPAVASGAPADGYIAIGWGDYGFYHDTPNWGDLTAAKVIDALSGRGPATLHTRLVAKPNPSACQRLTVDRAGHDSLSRFVLAALDTGTDGRPRVLDAPATDGGVFYAAKGNYSPWNTCNVWAGDALAVAGLRHAFWAPFSFGVTWPLRLGERTSPIRCHKL